MDLNAHSKHRYTGLALASAAAALVAAACGPSAGAGSAGAAASKPAAGSSVTASPAQGTSGSAVGLADYPVAVGNTWVYQNSLGGTVTNKMIAVTPVSGGTQVTQTSTLDLTGSPSTTQEIYVFHSDGSITYPANQFSDVSVQGGIVWPTPAEIAAGQPNSSTLQITSTQGQSLNVTAHVVVQGAGSASITVPAGTYQATIIDMTMSYAVQGITVSIEVQTWLANGVGPVQSEVTTTEESVSHVADELKLQSFAKG
jgi:hypothetical protein